MKLLNAFCLTLLFACTPVLADKPATTDAKPIFNGKDLSDWQGRDDLWSVEDGTIVGRTTKEKPIKGNTFLIYQGEQPDNFILTLQYKIESGNSGIQYRSKIVDEEKFVISGYQADIDMTNRFAGILYEEKGRGILAQRGEKVTIDKDGKKSKAQFGDAAELGKGIHAGEWNDYRVIANGNHLQHYINGTLTAEVIDDQTGKSAASGYIALQLHQGAAMVVRFKNISMRKFK